MSDIYKIGFYNNKIEDDKGFEDFNIIFDDFDKLKKHLRENDVVTFKSEFSFYDMNIKEMIDIIDEYNLKIEFLNFSFSGWEGINSFTINVLLAIFEFIKDNKNIIKKLLNWVW